MVIDVVLYPTSLTWWLWRMGVEVRRCSLSHRRGVDGLALLRKSLGGGGVDKLSQDDDEDEENDDGEAAVCIFGSWWFYYLYNVDECIQKK